MKQTKILWVVLATATLSVGSASAARADQRIIATVPFPFIVGEVRLPAGDYVVTDETSSGGQVLAIVSSDGRRFVYALTIPSSSEQASTRSELVFEKFANQYFLARIVPADSDEREIVLTPAIMERELVEVAATP